MRELVYGALLAMLLALSFLSSNVAGDTGTPGFQTMSAESVSNTVNVVAGTAPAAPEGPTNLAATLQAGPQVSLTWRDNTTTETGFVVECCAFVAPATTCNNFVEIATPGPGNNTGNVTYVDTTVAFNTNYLYRVAAFNAAGTSAYATLASAVMVPAIPAAPTSFTVSAVHAGGNRHTATLTWALPTGAPNPTNFTIQRAENLDFTTNLNTVTVAGNLTTVNQTVTRNTVYYYRIRANNSAGGSSAWTNALPFPIRTGP